MNNNMKKIFYLLLSSLLMMSLYSCSSDDDNDEGGNSLPKKVNVSLIATYNVEGKEVPDVGAVVYLFNALTLYNEAGWKYAGNGKFESKNWGRETSYNHKGIVKENGVFFELDQLPNEKFFTVVVESATDVGKESRSFGITTFDYRETDHYLKYVYGSQHIKRIE